jgi:hypothetical protein
MAETANYDKVIRCDIADYLNIGTDSNEEYVLMGVGVDSLDEQPSAKIDKTAYVSDRSVSGTIIGYENKFAFDMHLMAQHPAIRKIYDISRNQKTGSDAEADYVRVDLYDGEGENVTSFPARKFRVAIEVSGVTGAGTEIVRVAGNLHQVGNFVEGTFNTQTKTFTPKT